MHDGALALHDLTWREIVETHHCALVDELSKRLDSDLKRLELEREDAVASALAGERSRLKVAIDELRRSQAEEFNQSLRRLRQANGEAHILQALNESCAAYAEVSVVLVFENNQAHVAASRGVDAGDFSFDIVSAPAVVAAIDSRDPVVALATEAELSAGLAEQFRAQDNVEDNDVFQRNAYLFPLTARHSVVAMLIAAGRTKVISPPIELLCEAAGMRLETLLLSSERGASERAAPSDSLQPELFEIKPLPVAAPDSTSAAAKRLTWDALSSEDQQLHLRAQRLARVRIAEMRLYNEADLRNGVASSDIYGALQPVIDTARNQFLHEFLAKSPTMVDYLHLEILSSLAHDDDRLLGHNYPGPMV
jgi:hypothetical protein